MISRLLLSLFTLSCFVSLAYGQGRPAWADSIRDTVKKEEPTWTFKEGELKTDGNWYRYMFRVSRDKAFSSAQLHWYDTMTNREETFEGLVTIRDNSSNGSADRIKVDGIGDLAYAFSNKKTGDWTGIIYRKGKMFVMLNCSSELFCRRSAQLIAHCIPD